MNLADNSEVILPVHKAIILWNGEEREIRVFATGRRPLVGTALLDEHELVVQFTEGGLVTIDELYFQCSIAIPNTSKLPFGRSPFN